ncbi:unnamed protein product [Auanema sp. JU1783]|nr:unnamed protein product [Auanema sp. JU1783]
MSTQEAPQDFDVVVVGAGLAGLSAVRELRKKDPNLKILVIEAKDRVGGRTLTVPIMGPGQKPVKFDLGGQWVGHTQRHINQLIKELGLKTYEQYEAGTKYAQIGTPELRQYSGNLPITTLQQFTPVEVIDWYASLSKTEKLVKQVDLKDPFSWKEASNYDGMTLEKWCQENCITRTSHDCMDLKTTAIYGVKPSRVNMLYHLAFSKAAGTFSCLVNNIGDGAQAVRVTDGTQQMCEIMANDFGTQNILLNRAVDEIIYDEKTGLTLIHAYSTLPGEKDVYEYFQCSRVIMAIPPNQCGYIKFTPDVPLIKSRLFESCPVGNFIKFIITYETPFWRLDGHSGEIISTGRTSSTGEIFPLIEVYDACSSRGVPALVGFISEEFTDMSMEERKEAIVKDLERFFGVKCRTQMVDYVEKLWVHEPFNGGCPTVAVTPGNMDAFTTIRQPHYSVHFAGTETALEWMGYMSGAVESGLRAANEVLYELGKKHLVSNKHLNGSVYEEDYQPPKAPGSIAYMKTDEAFDMTGVNEDAFNILKSKI